MAEKRKKTGGRQKGTKNKKTTELIEKVKSEGITPLEYMLQIMRQEIPKDADLDQKIALKAQKMDAANKAAPYVHPKLVATHTTTDETPQTLEAWLDDLSDKGPEGNSSQD